MIVYYALRGFHIEDKAWTTFVVLKAMSRKEAELLMCQYRRSHVQNCPFSNFKIDDIGLATFSTLGGRDDCRSFVAQSVLKHTAESKRKKELLVGAP